MTVTQVAYPVAPTTSPRKGTLLDAAAVTDGIKWLDGLALFDSYNCMRFESIIGDICTPASKTFDNSPQWTDGFRFGAYGGAVCRAMGLDHARMQSEVERVFNAGESTAVERALMQTRFVQSAADGSIPAGDRWAAPVDLTPVAGAVAPSVGVGLLEGYAGSVYVGQPTLHLPISIASALAARDGLVWDGNILRTKMGAKVAAGAGYDHPNTSPAGADAAVGEKWLYATGEVAVGRGEAIVRQVMAHEANDVYVLGERAYIAAVDCFAAAVRVTVTA